jgi:hypothetical protein
MGRISLEEHIPSIRSIKAAQQVKLYAAADAMSGLAQSAADRHEDSAAK